MTSGKPGFLWPTNAQSPSTRRFWEGLSENKLLGQHCTECGMKFFPPRAACPRCLAADLEWFELSGQGTLHSWTRVHVAGPEFETPFTLGIVDLEEGIGRITAKIHGDLGRLEIGAPVRVGYFRSDADFTMYCVVLG